MASPKGQATEDTTGLSNYFIKLKFGTVDIPVDAINSIVIREWIFDIVPRLEMTLTDNGSLAELWSLEDNTEITIELGKNSGLGELSQINNHIIETFIVDNSSIDILAGNKTNIISVTAYMKYTDLFHPIHSRAFKKKTSIDVLSQIAGEVGWKLNARTASSSDAMTWLQINQSNYDMIRHVLKRSSISNDLLFAYADIGGRKDKIIYKIVNGERKVDRIETKNISSKFNIVSLKTETEEKEFKIMRFDLQKAAADSFDEKADEQTLWTNGFKFNNMSGYLNKVIGGYGLTSTYYDLTKSNIISSKIDYHPYSKVNGQNHLGDYIDSVNFGSLTDNTNPNYYKGILTNRNLMGISFGSMITAKVNPIGEIDLMDSVNFAVPSINETTVNTLLGGSYLVCGKCWYASKGSPLQLEVSMCRNGRNNSGYNLETDKP